MKKLSLLIVSFCFATIAVCQSSGTDNYWQQQVNYTIDVDLNDIDHTLDGYIKMEYINNSPDSLHFIWIHLWPNAYKNDRTAFSDQLLENGRTDFYFSDNDKRGYINRLDFKVNGSRVKMEDHPQHQDIIKIMLPQPLAPYSSCKIETPFHEKIPANFSRGGHTGKAYQLTQWYPKPAVYDRKGWHPIPYLDQGEFYSEFGNYKVAITLPNAYEVAATGKLVDSSHSTASVKTLSFEQKNVHDFALFADPKFIVAHDTLQLASSRIIDVYAYYLPSATTSSWQQAVRFIKNAVVTRSKWLGEYPYDIVSAVEAPMGFEGGMEYPCITSISPGENAYDLEGTIEHEIGHNWNYGILATNEREHPWMDEGLNSYFDERYTASQMLSKPVSKKETFVSKRLPLERRNFQLRNTIAVQKDQPIETTSDKFSEINYYRIAYDKTAQWLSYLEKSLGTSLFDSCMHEYYNRWKFKHPYPEDIKKVFEDVSGKNLDAEFSLLNAKGNIPGTSTKRPTKFASFFSFKETNKYKYIFAAPAIGNNFYDKLMIGAIIHNYTLPAEKFQFLVAPLYGTHSKQMNGIGRLSYTWYPKHNGQKFELALSGMSFSDNSFTDSTGHNTYQRFSKIVPSLKYVFGNKNPRSQLTKFLQWKTFFIGQQGLLFTRDTVNDADIITYPTTNTYINQLRFVIQNARALYPYNGELTIEQGKDFVRTALTANYYFNYAKGGGMNVRFFAGKFFYLGDNTYLKQFETDPYHLNMSGPKGYEDYTYSNYFYGRNEFEGAASQQIMERDGFFKVRTDLLSDKIGKTDNWLIAANFTTDVPKNINPLQMLPIKIPLKAFVDIGTYADAWQKNAATGKFIYDAGLQLSLLKNVVNIYVPLFYSKVYSDYFKSTIVEKRFWKNISFSIDIQKISLKKIVPQLSL
ncbi:M1 family metallopeptidase [Ferruginibacter lapsinanis]|uniref:M1 family metallopeptidase n=1 Tax=Ferruginibacter lapsinanis TaxID=563172 RepID=UPI001E34AC05|nr:M1 family metallopeptidase [Ferruginibacter lapsinanis]UEG48817.1 M1 family metallopeptidase [Ferruginibacter lapsinanis]